MMRLMTKEPDHNRDLYRLLPKNTQRCHIPRLNLEYELTDIMNRSGMTNIIITKL